jgi:hypothetical protein
LQRAPQLASPAPDALAQFTLGTSTAIEMNNRLLFTPLT